MQREFADAVLSVRVSFETLRPGALIDATGTRRRIEALQCSGYSQSWIAERIGMDPPNFARVAKCDRVKVSTRNSIAAVFDEFVLVPRSSDVWHERTSISRTLNHARRSGFVPALAWDDIDFDVSPAVADGDVIDDIAVELASSGVQVRLTPLERREAVRRAYALKLSDQQIADRIGCTDATVLRIRQELGLPALFNARGSLIA